MASREDMEEVVMLPLTEVGSIKWTAARGQKMRELRGDIPLLNLSKRLTEFEVDISRQYLNRMETNTDVKNASPEVLTALCKIFGCTLAELLCLKSTKIVQLGVDVCN
ncbi:helix-turn-helix transcriptional regulator [Nostoc sp. DedSLP04]|uniref:helix-turn-helix domain-containing protein n=1 Tax=Nostoc sp. DedSLP04 TaxID=3075401 RepID=UPI002AD44DE8|nr:helix-turn-helix transcriptional regulator [Nostoc sp. DedSLP04]MDZ8034061.1 helix-turn-helix transcriptional regulator [Nostoc sp. DedSLP04]